jgi:tRNA pseudouridine55 synthase
MATGILPLALNEATKAFQFVATNTKSYHFTVQWGAETDTDDAEGEVTRASDLRPTHDDIECMLSQFVGEVMQAPPAFSAIKVDGKRSYALARQGEVVALAARPVRIDALRLLQMPDENHAYFEMTCGKGTYVRSVARDMGRKLGCLGHVTALRRTVVGEFNENNAISLEKLEDLVHSARLEEWLLPVSSVLADIPALEIDPAAARRIRNGQPIVPPMQVERNAMVQLVCDGILIAVATATEDGMRPVRVFNLDKTG